MTKLNKINVLVIGGAGYIGSHTVMALTESGYRAVILDNFSNSDQQVLGRLKKLTGTNITSYKADYQDIKKLEEIIIKEDINGIIHFAAYKAVAESVANPLKYYDNNVAGFISLLKVINKLKVKHLVFSSSAAVYGDPPVSKVTEETICSPTSPYGWTKYMDDIILRDVSTQSHFQATSLRYFNVVGAHESALIGELPKGRPQNLMPIITQATAKLIPPLTVFGTDYDTPDGSCLRDYVHVVDLASAHVKALEHQLINGNEYNLYNIGTGKPTSVLELIKTFERVNKIKVPYALGNRRPGDPAAYYASPAKANRELKWVATKTIEDAALDAWRWQKAL